MGLCPIPIQLFKRADPRYSRRHFLQDPNGTDHDAENVGLTDLTQGISQLQKPSKSPSPIGSIIPIGPRFPKALAPSVQTPQNVQI